MADRRIYNLISLPYQDHLVQPTEHQTSLPHILSLSQCIVSPPSEAPSAQNLSDAPAILPWPLYHASRVTPHSSRVRPNPARDPVAARLAMSGREKPALAPALADVRHSSEFFGDQRRPCVDQSINELMFDFFDFPFPPLIC